MYRNVPQSTVITMYRNVPQRTINNINLPQSTAKYRNKNNAPQCTAKYRPEVPRFHHLAAWVWRGQLGAGGGLVNVSLPGC